jgi:GntR family transcriptional regulator, transcriptional repressor for pyruvate dehydrogenase complex
MEVRTEGATLPQELMGSLLRFIRDRRFEPGERLPSERELSERFGVSRNSVREVLGTLEWFRMVERRPSSGVYLRERLSDYSPEALVLSSGLGIELDEKEVLQSMETRSLIELQACRLCASRRTDQDLARLQELLEETQRYIAEGRNVAELDGAFHLAIVEGTGNAVLARVVKPFYLMSARQRHLYFTSAAKARKSLSDHRKLVAAISDRDPEQAARVLGEHLGGVENHWRKALA